MRSLQHCVFLVLALYVTYATSTAEVYNLEQGETRNIDKYFNKHLHIFCYKGKPKYIIHLWQSVLLKINHTTNDYTRYDGATSEIVEKEYMKRHYSWSLNIFTKDHNIKLNPFNDTCLGIESKDAYNVNLSIVAIDFWKVLYLAIGAVLFLSARRLSNNTVFYYACGVAIGICASFVILIYFLSKLFPRKPIMYGFLGAGWTVVLYMFQFLWDNIRTILELYKIYVLWYILFSAVVSFIVIYRWGPVENDRTKNLMRWILQGIGLTLIYCSSHFQEAAMAQVVFIVMFYNTPKTVYGFPRKIWLKKFPPKVKLLSSDEYYEQGVRETRKALEELRSYCTSPECNQWKMALKLHDVKRFASFIEGNSHLSDDEILDYETSINNGLTDEEDNEYTDDEY